MDVLKVITPLIEVESKMAELYSWFSYVFKTDPEISSLFYRMAAEEKSHASLIRYAKRVLIAEKSFYIDVELQVGDLQKVLAKIKETLAKHEAPSLEEAFRFAGWVETSCAENPLEFIMMDNYPQIAKLLTFLGKKDREHYNRLVGVAAARSIDLPGMEERK